MMRKGWLRIGIGFPAGWRKPFWCLLVLAVLVPGAAFCRLPGDYETIVPFSPPPEHSLDTVTIHEVFAFDCPHCFHFHQTTKQKLEHHFGGKVHFIPQPIGWRGHDPGRLYFIAEEKGKGEQVLVMIFDFVFEKGLGAEMFKRDKLRFVARLTGLTEEFNTLMDHPRIVAKMNESVEFARERNINATPTLVVEGVLIPNRKYENLVTIINGLLKEPVR